MGKHVVGKVANLPPGQRMIVTLERKSIGVFNVKGKYYALKNTCPHQQAELCVGTVTGTNLPSKPGEYIWDRDGEILRCPWHGWEFDITNGKSIFDPHKCLVKTYDVTVESGDGEEDDQSVETYPVTVESGNIVVEV